MPFAKRNCVTVARQTLTLFVGVRIPIPLKKARRASARSCFFSGILKRDSNRGVLENTPVRTDCRFRIRSPPLSARISRKNAKFLKLSQHDTSSTVKFRGFGQSMFFVKFSSRRRRVKWVGSNFKRTLSCSRSRTDISRGILSCLRSKQTIPSAPKARHAHNTVTISHLIRRRSATPCLPCGVGQDAALTARGAVIHYRVPRSATLKGKAFFA